MPKKQAGYFFLALMVISSLVVLWWPSHSASLAKKQETDTPDLFFQARVLRILDEGEKEVDGVPQPYQKVELRIENGSEKGKIILIDHGSIFTIQEFQKVHENEVVVVNEPNTTAKENFYYIIDTYRAPRLGFLVGIFLLAAFIFGKKQGLAALLGMVISLGVLFYGVVPAILAGKDPLLVSVAGGFAILGVSLYVAHGFRERTHIAALGTVLSFLIALVVNFYFVIFARINGSGTEEAFYLQLDVSSLDLRALLMGGIMIGVLGVLDDVTTAQAAAIEEIYIANPTVSFRSLYTKGMSVGREHIASLINTLLLAYAGVSFPLIIFFAYQKSQPLWIMLNSAFISEEVVRTLVGSLALVLAVPITTALAAWWFAAKNKKPNVVVL